MKTNSPQASLKRRWKEPVIEIEER